MGSRVPQQKCLSIPRGALNRRAPQSCPAPRPLSLTISRIYHNIGLKPSSSHSFSKGDVHIARRGAKGLPPMNKSSLVEFQASVGFTIWGQRSFVGASHTVPLALQPQNPAHFPTTAGPLGPSPFEWVLLHSNPKGLGHHGPVPGKPSWAAAAIRLLLTFPTLFSRQLNQRMICSCRRAPFWPS